MIDKVLGIIAWGLILFAIVVIILKAFGIIHSPPVVEIFLGGMFVEFLRIETKFKEFGIELGFLWKDFKKRREI